MTIFGVRETRGEKALLVALFRLGVKVDCVAKAASAIASVIFGFFGREWMGRWDGMREEGR